MKQKTEIVPEIQENPTALNICRVLDWRREWDSNPRQVSLSPVFKTGSLNRSDISPYGFNYTIGKRKSQ